MLNSNIALCMIGLLLVLSCNTKQQTLDTFTQVIQEADFVNQSIANFIPSHYYKSNGLPIEPLRFSDESGNVILGKFDIMSLPTKVKKGHGLSVNFQIDFAEIDKTFRYSVYHNSHEKPFNKQEAEVHCHLSGIGKISIAPYLSFKANNLSLSPDTQFFEERSFGQRNLKNVYCGISSFTEKGTSETEDCEICIAKGVGLVAFTDDNAFYVLQQ